MNENCTEQLVDVRILPPRQRHPLIFRTWEQLPTGEAMLLANDHDPLPLYYQFACEHQRQFHWEYLEQGPEVWRVRISKGSFPDTGFAPPKRPRRACSPSALPGQPLVLDVRLVFARGETPCEAIDEAVASVAPGQALVLLVPFEPVPLYAKLKHEGFSHEARQLEDGSWRIEFRKQA
jgi:uncharacterized protein (DUF2249 family)